MKIGKARIAAVALGAVALTSALSSAAFADLAPTKGDVVGVGSDTLQYAGDFIADGDYLGDVGYNSYGNVNRVVNFDATPDANARLAYGSGGVSGSCGPGTGATAGTGNAVASHTDTPCTLNPTIVLREGLNPVLRPNGSGAGAKALLNDKSDYINYARASSAQGATLGTSFDSITIGTDPLEMLAATTTNAVALSIAQLKTIYSAASGSCVTWDKVGGKGTDAIIPILPQIGSGTRSSFLSAIGVSTPGTCALTFEENDPTAIFQTSNPADAILPMSGARLDLFQGKSGSTGASNGSNGYFIDPSCPVEQTSTNCPVTPSKISPAVGFLAGAPSDGGAIFDVNRPLYIYFRDADINAKTAFQPGSTLNWVRTLFYNPCSGTDLKGNPINQAACVTVGGSQYGPGGAPYYASTAGATLISAAGIKPEPTGPVFTAAGP